RTGAPRRNSPRPDPARTARRRGSSGQPARQCAPGRRANPPPSTPQRPADLPPAPSPGENTMTHLFDDPTSFPADAVEGLVAAHPEELLRVHGGVVRKQARSEERRVGKECRGRWWAGSEKK